MVRNRNLVMLVRRERLIAARALPWLPRWLHFLGRNRFESARKLASVKSPVLIVHGDLDRTIPVAEEVDDYSRRGPQYFWLTR